MSAIGHNGGPSLEDEPAQPNPWQRGGSCATCAHWKPPAESDVLAYRAFKNGHGRRVREPAGYCHNVRMSERGGVASAATADRSCCWNFDEKPPALAGPGSGGFVTIYREGRIVWKGWSEDVPPRFRDEEPAPAAHVDQLVDSAPAAPIGHNRPPAKPKPTPAQLRAELGRMLQARRQVAAELAAIEASIEHQAHEAAEDGAIARVGGARLPSGRHNQARWRPTHERAYRELLAEKLEADQRRRRPELDRLRGKLERQTAAAQAFARKHSVAIDLERGRVLEEAPKLKRYVLRRNR